MDWGKIGQFCVQQIFNWLQNLPLTSMDQNDPCSLEQNQSKKNERQPETEDRCQMQFQTFDPFKSENQNRPCIDNQSDTGMRSQGQNQNQQQADFAQGYNSLTQRTKRKHKKKRDRKSEYQSIYEVIDLDDQKRSYNTMSPLQREILQKIKERRPLQYRDLKMARDLCDRGLIGHFIKVIFTRIYQVTISGREEDFLTMSQKRRRELQKKIPFLIGIFKAKKKCQTLQSLLIQVPVNQITNQQWEKILDEQKIKRVINELANKTARKDKNLRLHYCNFVPRLREIKSGNKGDFKRIWRREVDRQKGAQN